MRAKALFGFMQERHAIYTRRQAGQPKPWTRDPILRNYRFCNVYRELDTVTRWIAKNWRDPHTGDPHVWFAMAAARFVNWPDTLAECGYPVPWEPRVGAYSMREHFTNTLLMRHSAGEKVFTGAYIINAGTGSKALHVTRGILTPLWENREYIREAATSLARFHERLMEFRGMGSFMAGQVVCDAKYTRLLDAAPDWWDWACPGPGSERGLNRVMGRPAGQRWKKGEWLPMLLLLKLLVEPLVHDAGMPPVHAQDLQNCLCEFDKYERVRLGEGKPRSRYAGF